MKPFGTLVLFMLSLSACNNYLDLTKEEKKIPVQQGEFIFSFDYNTLNYKSNIYVARDEEKLKPKSFTVNLPRKIKFYNLSNSEDFCFFMTTSRQSILKWICRLTNLLGILCILLQKRK